MIKIKADKIEKAIHKKCKAFFTKETPAKVGSLLGVAMASMFLLFVTSYTNGGETSFPDPFAPQKVVAVIDNTAASYSQFLAQNLFSPVKQDLAYYGDTFAWIIDESDTSIVHFAGLDGFVKPKEPKPMVAGAYTEVGCKPQLSYSATDAFSFLKFIGLK